MYRRIFGSTKRYLKYTTASGELIYINICVFQKLLYIYISLFTAFYFKKIFHQFYFIIYIFFKSYERHTNCAREILNYNFITIQIVILHKFIILDYLIFCSEM